MKENKTYAASIDKYFAPTFLIAVGNCESRKDEYIVGSGRDAILVNWDGVSGVATYNRTVFTAQEDDPTILLDVARQSLQGHLYGGTLHPTLCAAPKTATFFKYSNATGNLQQIDDGLSTTLGVAFDNNKNLVFGVDFCSGIRSYDADCDANCEATLVFNSTSIGKHFAGLDSDSDGNLYSSEYYDGTIWKFDPSSKTGEVVVNMTTYGCSGVTFGGQNLDILFVICGSSLFYDNLTPKEIRNVPTLYQIVGLGVEGQPTGSLNLN